MIEDSMMLWYPKIKNLDIPQPKTEIYEIPKNVLENLCEENMENLDMNAVKEVANRIGYPLFLRTDLASGKFFWKMSCFVEKEEDLQSHIFEVISFNQCAGVVGLPFEALVFREYIQMKNLFTAFYGEMPVNPEIRFFVENGEVLCWHWYWAMEAIKQPSVSNWKEILENEKKSVFGNEILWLTTDARKVSKVLDGYWSVDFCKAKNDKWILIDCARADLSWHPDDCKFKKKVEKNGFI
jgi:hypothetical protein